MNWPDALSLPYCVSCDSKLLKIKVDRKTGITLTGFYAPQGRNLRLKSNAVLKTYTKGSRSLNLMI